jgi:hypothetical protein
VRCWQFFQTCQLKKKGGAGNFLGTLTSQDGERGEFAKNLRASPFNGDPNDATFSQIHLNGH